MRLQCLLNQKSCFTLLPKSQSDRQKRKKKLSLFLWRFYMHFLLIKNIGIYDGSHVFFFFFENIFHAENVCNHFFFNGSITGCSRVRFRLLRTHLTICLSTLALVFLLGLLFFCVSTIFWIDIINIIHWSIFKWNIYYIPMIWIWEMYIECS